MKFNPKTFFNLFRQKFGSLTQEQVSGLNRLLWGFETYYGWWDNLSQIANALAQIKHETAHSFQPVEEGYYLGTSERVKGFQKSLRYYPHFGRGDIQLTWFDNYRKMDALIRQYFPEIVAGYNRIYTTQFNLKDHPEQALDGKISFCVFTIGMHKGTFTGQTLNAHTGGREVDHFNARSIVNGDKHRKTSSGIKIGDVIARDALKFEEILRASKISEDFENLKESEINLKIPTAVAVHDSATQSPVVNPALLNLENPVIPQSQPSSGPTESTQIAENIQNVVESKAEEKAIQVAQSSPPVEIEKTEPTRFLDKLWKTIAGIFAGTIALPAFLQNGFDYNTALSKILEIVLANFKYILFGGVIGLSVWYLTKKFNAYKLSALVANINANPAKRDIKFVDKKF